MGRLINKMACYSSGNFFWSPNVKVAEHPLTQKIIWLLEGSVKRKRKAGCGRRSWECRKAE